jgi:hypothetical protein
MSIKELWCYCRYHHHPQKCSKNSPILIIQAVVKVILDENLSCVVRFVSKRIMRWTLILGSTYDLKEGYYLQLMSFNIWLEFTDLLSKILLSWHHQNCQVNCSLDGDHYKCSANTWLQFKAMEHSDWDVFSDRQCSVFQICIHTQDMI